MKKILVGVSGGIAAFKTCQLVSDLVKNNEVQVIMTKNACEFINPLTFESLTGRKCLIDTFDRNFQHKTQHISAAKWADVFVIAPATANLIAKIACGICDDMLTTTFLACDAPKIIAPAMNTAMYENPVTLRNIQTIKELGMIIAEPDEGYLACGDTGKGKMADIKIIQELVNSAGRVSSADKASSLLAGKKILVTAGPTIEPIDPVRYITNHSSGKMGYEIAKAAARMGGEVTLVSGRTNLEKPTDMEVVDILTAEEMYNEVMKRSENCDFVVMAAAVADYTPADISTEKVKKQDNDLSLNLKRTKDILKTLGERKRPGQVLCGFAMETRDLLENAAKKLAEKNADMIVANNLKVEGAGFAHDTNVAAFVTKEGITEKEIMLKSELAVEIWRQLAEMGSSSEK